jgi:alcohol dehydrogenase (cytochrome c)
MRLTLRPGGSFGSFISFRSSRAIPPEAQRVATPQVGKWRATSRFGGGATWTSYSLDPDTGLLYVAGGNPSPDFAAAVRGGGDLYTGSVVILDARTGAYKEHFKIVPKDWHDWDVSGAPAIVKTVAGKRVMLVAPKDGHLYGFDLDTKDMLYRLPVTAIENADVLFSPEKSVHFCPGSIGGAEWNGPAYNPQNNLVMIARFNGARP